MSPLLAAAVGPLPFCVRVAGTRRRCRSPQPAAALPLRRHAEHARHGHVAVLEARNPRVCTPPDPQLA